MINENRLQLWEILLLLTLGLAIALRFWNISINQFLFYDEGMYLGFNRSFLDLVSHNPPKSINEFFIILGLMFKQALGTAKALWFFILNLRVFILNPEAWYFARIISACCGVLTIFLTYVFAFRYFQSKKIAIMSALFLTLLPSHVFYSRLGMQESLSAFLFLSALSVYILLKNKKWSAGVAAALLACVFLTNYRMIISPLFIIAIEGFDAWVHKRRIDWVKIFVCVGIYGAIIFIIGSLYGGINRHVTFGWMFHQAQEAQEQSGLINFLSYPLYTFILEGIFFGLLFWSNLYLIFRKHSAKILPFVLVLLQMGLFSFAAEKGARYLCVLLPFMAMAAAVAVDYFLNSSVKRIYLSILIVLACLVMSILSTKIIFSTTDYESAVNFVLEKDPNARIISTQPLVEQLYVKNERNVTDCPKDLFDLINLYKQGYRYLILDPQVYISWTKDNQRFSPPLIDFLEVIKQEVPPLKSFQHLNNTLMDRFVLDHNQNLFQSISFLSESSKLEYGQIRIYDLEQVFKVFRQQELTGGNINL